MAALLSCKSVRMAGSSAAARRMLPAVGGRFMQLVPQRQAPCRRLSSAARVVQNPGQNGGQAGFGNPAGYAPAMYQVPQEAAGMLPVPMGPGPGITGPVFNGTVFTDFSVYKTKGAMSVKPIKPTWATVPPGGYKVERNGAMLFELANPIQGAERRYNWEQKVVIGLQANELSTILADPAGDHQFYHDTFKGQPGKQGTLVKTLKWSRAPDGNAYFINASVKDTGNNINNSVSVSLTNSEFYTFKRLVDYAIPYLLGWDALFSQP